jgi:hypothetical protein
MADERDRKAVAPKKPESPIRDEAMKASKPEDYRRLADKYKQLLSSPAGRILLGSMTGVDDCWPLATCLRVTASDNPEYEDKEFVPVVKRYFESVKNAEGQDSETRTAYFFLTMVADRESGWKTEYSQEDTFGQLVTEKTDGVEIPQGKPGDVFKLGPAPQELIAWAKKTMIEHLKMTKDWRDLKDVNDLMMRAMKWIEKGVESEDTYLKIADCADFVEVVEKRRDEWKKTVGKEMEMELGRFDGLKNKLVNQPRRV